jgi:hypothetical protein
MPRKSSENFETFSDNACAKRQTVSMSRASALTHVSMLVIFFAGLAAPRAHAITPDSSCTALLAIDATRNERTDQLTVCDDGRLLASHAFSKPAPESMPSSQMIWQYSGHVDDVTLTDLKAVLGRKDVAQLPPQVEVLKGDSNDRLLWTLNMAIALNGETQNISLRNLPLAICRENPSGVTPTELDMMCMFEELFAQAENGTLPKETDCNCRTLHAMAFWKKQSVQ